MIGFMQIFVTYYNTKSHRCHLIFCNVIWIRVFHISVININIILQSIASLNVLVNYDGLKTQILEIGINCESINYPVKLKFGFLCQDYVLSHTNYTTLKVKIGHFIINSSTQTLLRLQNMPVAYTNNQIATTIKRIAQICCDEK